MKPRPRDLYWFFVPKKVPTQLGLAMKDEGRLLLAFKVFGKPPWDRWLICNQLMRNTLAREIFRS